MKYSNPPGRRPLSIGDARYKQRELMKDFR
jgi:hypothetical protein